MASNVLGILRKGDLARRKLEREFDATNPTGERTFENILSRLRREGLIEARFALTPAGEKALAQMTQAT